MTQESKAIVPVSNSSNILNIVLHTIYGLSCTHYFPSVPTISAGIPALKSYSFHLPTYVLPSSPFFTSPSPTPLKAPSRATPPSVSLYLLSFSLPMLTDDTTQRIGPIYLKHLFFLHLGCCDALKCLLLLPPHPHAPTPDCDFVEQTKAHTCLGAGICLPRLGRLAGHTGSTLESALTPLGARLWCKQCCEVLQERIRTLIVQWSVVKVHVWVLVAVQMCIADWVLWVIPLAEDDIMHKTALPESQYRAPIFVPVFCTYTTSASHALPIIPSASLHRHCRPRPNNVSPESFPRPEIPLHLDRPANNCRRARWRE
ncbi:hypothetical protein K439DRAFT_56447 [Ramaria rubella]|nr:hypothetical protein K439DRAFT_56447 [Ramaria rubella]